MKTVSQAVVCWHAFEVVRNLALQCGLRSSLKVEIGYSLLPDYWAKGYTKEIVEALIQYARDLGKIEELIGIIDGENSGLSI